MGQRLIIDDRPQLEQAIIMIEVASKHSVPETRAAFRLVKRGFISANLAGRDEHSCFSSASSKAMGITKAGGIYRKSQQTHTRNTELL